MAALWGVALAAGGCEERIIGSHYGTMGDFPKSAEEPPMSKWQKQEEVGSDAATDAPWAIALDAYGGPDHRAVAEQRRVALSRDSGVKDMWVADDGQTTVVYSGHYASVDDKQAQADLRRWRERQSRTPTASCLLVPVNPSGGVLSKFDLRSMVGKGLYTLQIGFYDEAFGKGFRKAAEQAVATLRKEGVEAYFYHGPHRSMVTVGVFGENATVAATHGEFVYRQYAPVIEALQRKFPYNFGNGSSIIQKSPMGKATTQPSFLVQLPTR